MLKLMGNEINEILGAQTIVIWTKVLLNRQNMKSIIKLFFLNMRHKKYLKKKKLNMSIQILGVVGKSAG